MIDQRMIFEIHRLANEGLSPRRIARTLALSRKTVVKYLNDPNPKKPPLTRASKLDPFKDEIERMLDRAPAASAVVIRQRLIELGFDGGVTIVKDYLRKLRHTHKHKKAFIRFESAPGEQCQIDWGHFGSMDYGNTKRKVYCLAVIESHSRLLYLEFTHSQRQETLHRCLYNAFCFFRGTPRELVHDNMLTAVIERDGSLIRFNERFLAFLRPFKIIPRACNVASPHEKGKVEKGAIHYIRYNLTTFRPKPTIGGISKPTGGCTTQQARGPSIASDRKLCGPFRSFYPIAGTRPRSRCLPTLPSALMATPIPFPRGRWASR
jgi:transposase